MKNFILFLSLGVMASFISCNSSVDKDSDRKASKSTEEAASPASDYFSEENVVVISVDPQGRIFLTMNNDTAANYTDQKMRAEALVTAIQLYNDQHQEKITVTEIQKTAFTTQPFFGVPMKNMPEFLDLLANGDPEKTDQWLSGNYPGHDAGIPIGPNTFDRDNLNEFQNWIKAICRTNNPKLLAKIKAGEGIIIRAQDNTDSGIIRTIIDNLYGLRIVKFYFDNGKERKPVVLGGGSLDNPMESPRITADAALTLIADNDKLYYYFGAPFNGKEFTAENNNLKFTALPSGNSGLVDKLIRENNFPTDFQPVILVKSTDRATFGDNLKLMNETEAFITLPYRLDFRDSLLFSTKQIEL